MKPVIGEAVSYDVETSHHVPWVLGTQLTLDVGPLGRAPVGSRVLLIEAHEFARRKPYHHAKLTLVFAAMRQFRDRLRHEGYEVEYIKAERFRDGLEQYFETYPDDTLFLMDSPSHRSGEALRESGEAEGGRVEVVPNELFVATQKATEEWVDSRASETFTHESFYRWMRRKSGVLMDSEGPTGGEWNYDDQNREFPPAEWDSPPVYEPVHDELTLETSRWVDAEFETWGDTESFRWPVTREQALSQLEHVLEHRLPAFGPYQDAMRADDPLMAHTLLSPALNCGLIHPWEVITGVEEAYHERADVPLNSAEGVIRQILGWREFMRVVYRQTMPELAAANQLGASANLPAFYWSGDTDMACVRGCVEDVRQQGYSHHIQRLMVLSNFATLWGVEPQQLNEWFHATYVDAYHWVTTPNVIEMGSYAHGVFATKPYVSSANYIDKMSDYCEQCSYSKNENTGEGACPFNALYWEFLERHEDVLRSNHRMGLMYGHVDRKRDSGAMEELAERVGELREMEAEGTL